MTSKSQIADLSDNLTDFPSTLYNASLTQNLSIAEDTEPGQVTILFSLEYEDSKASSANSTETLTFNVSQPVRAELEVSDIPSVFYTMEAV